MVATPTRTDRIANRAPKGGMVSTLNGRFYKGGQFMPMARETAVSTPIKLAGSSRQVAWANRLRAGKIAEMEAGMASLLRLVGEKKGRATMADSFRYRELAESRQLLMFEPEASAIIDAFRS